MAEERLQRHLASLLSADVVGHIRRTEQDEGGTFERLRTLRKELFEPEIEKHKGHIFKLMGDGRDRIDRMRGEVRNARRSVGRH